MKQNISLKLSNKDIEKIKLKLLPLLQKYKTNEMDDVQLISNIIAQINIIYKLDIKYVRPKKKKVITIEQIATPN